jgi:hypothetical protein
VFTIVPTIGGNYADLAIEADGVIALIDPGRPPPRTTRPCRWNPSPTGGPCTQGAVHTTSTSSKGANLIGLLPPAARPSRTVYTILLTYRR